MKSRLDLSPSQRSLCTVIGVVLLLWAARGGEARQLTGLAGCLLILYAAGGGRVPWKVSWKDYLFYVVISVSLVAAVILYAILRAHRGR
jgi:hypothetical protein